jgi:retron-type reverse transcriptase
MVRQAKLGISCFDHIEHNALIEMLNQRIDDKRFIRLIQKGLKAGILDYVH